MSEYIKDKTTAEEKMMIIEHLEGQLEALKKREATHLKAIKGLLQAIETAKENGCIDHLDAWDNSEMEWYAYIEAAKAALKDTI